MSIAEPLLQGLLPHELSYQKQWDFRPPIAKDSVLPTLFVKRVNSGERYGRPDRVSGLVGLLVDTQTSL
jgi:hypothetical protein